MDCWLPKPGPAKGSGKVAMEKENGAHGEGDKRKTGNAGDSLSTPGPTSAAEKAPQRTPGWLGSLLRRPRH